MDVDKAGCIMLAVVIFAFIVSLGIPSCLDDYYTHVEKMAKIQCDIKKEIK